MLGPSGRANPDLDQYSGAPVAAPPSFYAGRIGGAGAVG